MKKIFTILLAVGSVTFASAQSVSHNGSRGHDEKGNSRDVILGQSNSSPVYRNNTADYGYNTYGNRYTDKQIQKINHEFDWKIASVKRDRHLRYYEKSRQIDMLERQRDQQIREMQMHFENRNRHEDNRYDNHK